MRSAKHPGGFWNPPPIPHGVATPLSVPQDVVSATDCTGLEIQPALNEAEAQHYAELYAIHEPKASGFKAGMGSSESHRR